MNNNFNANHSTGERHRQSLRFERVDVPMKSVPTPEDLHEVKEQLKQNTEELKHVKNLAAEQLSVSEEKADRMQQTVDKQISDSQKYHKTKTVLWYIAGIASTIIAAFICKQCGL